MVVKFISMYLKVLLSIVRQHCIRFLLLGWKYGFQTLLRNEMLNNVAIDLIIIFLVALVATIAQFALEDRKR